MLFLPQSWVLLNVGLPDLDGFEQLTSQLSPPNLLLVSAYSSNNLCWWLHVIGGQFVQGTALDSFRNSLRPPCDLCLSSKILFILVFITFGAPVGTVLVGGKEAFWHMEMMNLTPYSSFPLMIGWDVSVSEKKCQFCRY